MDQFLPRWIGVLCFQFLCSATFSQMTLFGDVYIAPQNELHIASGELYFESGKIITDRGLNSGTLSFARKASWNRANHDTHVDGFVRFYDTNEFTFPVGHDNVLQPFKLIDFKGSDHFDISYHHVPHPVNQTEEGIAALSQTQFWELRNPQGSGQVILSWNVFSNIDRLLGSVSNPQKALDLITIGGGHTNTASGERSAIGGGSGNTASGYIATIGGGVQNTASGGYASIGGGNQNTASGAYATISGGTVNTASSYGEWVGGLFSETYTAASSTTWQSSDRIFAVGNGRDPDRRSNALTILKNGNTGIGVSSPTQKLEVAGTVSATALILSGGGVVSETAGLFARTPTTTGSPTQIIAYDSAGNESTVSPHNFSLIGTPSEDMAWSFYSRNRHKNKQVNVDMMKMVRLVEGMSGQKLVHLADWEGNVLEEESKTEVTPMQEEIEQLKAQNQAYQKTLEALLKREEALLKREEALLKREEALLKRVEALENKED